MLVALLACGGGTKTPTTPPTPTLPPSIAAGTALTLVAGDTSQPVPNASVVISGQSPSGPFTSNLASNSAGQVIVDRQVLLSPAPLVDVVATGYLSRSTLLRPQGERVLSLWPTGGDISEGLAASLVYSRSSCPAEQAPSLPLRRIGSSASHAWIAFDSSLRDGAAMATHSEAVSHLNPIMGRLSYVVTSEAPPPGGITFTMKLDPAASPCGTEGGDGSHVIAFATNDFSASGEIVGGTVTYCAPTVARNVGAVAHELGHTAGFRHSPSPRDVMFCTTGRKTETFSDREAGIMGLMFQRRPGNTWPDNDRDATAALGRPSQETFVCH